MIVHIHSKFFYKLTPQLRVYDSNNTLLCYAERRVLTLKEEVHGYTNTDKTTPLFTIKASTVNDIAGSYDAYTADGRFIVRIKRELMQSIKTGRRTVSLSNELGQQIGQAKHIEVYDSNSNSEQLRMFWHGKERIYLGDQVIAKSHFDFQRSMMALTKMEKVRSFEFSDNAISTEFLLVVCCLDFLSES